MYSTKKTALFLHLMLKRKQSQPLGDNLIELGLMELPLLKTYMESYGRVYLKKVQYAQANSYLANRGGQGENSYLVMEGGTAIGFTHLTGKNIQWYHGSSDMYKYSNVEQATTQVIADALAAGAVGYVGGRKK